MRYEYLVCNADWLYTNTDKAASERMTRQFGEEGWELKGVIGDNLIMMRPNQHDLMMATYFEGKAVDSENTSKKEQG